jgi:hypothetical protein
MRSEPNQPGPGATILPDPSPLRRELYREPCQDKDGNPYTVIVYRPFPHLSIARYELEDGRPVRFIGHCLFEIESTGRLLSRCGDMAYDDA